MNIKQLQEELQVSENRILHHWKELCQSQERIGKILIKDGKGKSANYGILKKEDTVVRF